MKMKCWAVSRESTIVSFRGVGGLEARREKLLVNLKYNVDGGQVLRRDE